MLESQEPKYGIRNGHIFNRATGEVIPDDEPVFILRAKDRRAIPLLREYLSSVTNSEHAEAVRRRLGDFQHFKLLHPERMKEPDTSPVTVTATQP